MPNRVHWLAITYWLIAAIAPGAFAETMEETASSDARDLRRNEALIRELGGMGVVDHLIRERFLASRKDATEAERAALDRVWARDYQPIDEANSERLKALLKDRAWFSRAEVGAEAQGDALLVVIHSGDLAFQKAVLEKMEKLPALDEVSGYPNLYDRVAISDKRPQRYATQGTTCVDGQYAIPTNVEEPEKLEMRRNAAGLPPMATYLAGMNKLYGRCTAPAGQ